MDSPFAFAGSLLVILVGMSVVGVPLLKGVTLAIEGHREFKGDSMTRRTKTRGWVGAVIWSLVAIVIWSFYIDWARSGNIEYAKDALGYRIEKILESSSN